MFSRRGQESRLSLPGSLSYFHIFTLKHKEDYILKCVSSTPLQTLNIEGLVQVISIKGESLSYFKARIVSNVQQ